MKEKEGRERERHTEREKILKDTQLPAFKKATQRTMITSFPCPPPFHGSLLFIASKIELLRVSVTDPQSQGFSPPQPYLSLHPSDPAIWEPLVVPKHTRLLEIWVYLSLFLCEQICTEYPLHARHFLETRDKAIKSTSKSSSLLLGK